MISFQDSIRAKWFYTCMFQVTNQEAVDLVRPLCIGVDNPRPISACKKLTELSVARGSSDDISVLVIQLGQFVQ